MNRYRQVLKPLKLLQLNTRKGRVVHEITLTIAFEDRADIVLIQEPYISRSIERRITVHHPAYECFTPIDDWESPPRVLTYVRKGAGLRVEQLRPIDPALPAARDLLFLAISSPVYTLNIINVYNSPPGSIWAGAAVEALLNAPPSLFNKTFMAGDFNLHHHTWQPSYPHSTSSADPFVVWTEERRLSLTSEIDIPTHAQGNVLDLAFASHHVVSLGVETTAAVQLHTTSDHSPLITEINWDQRFQEHPARLKPGTLDTEKFLKLLEIRISTWSPGMLPGTQALDNAAEGLATAISEAYQGAATRSLGKGTGVPWWSNDCKDALREYRAAGPSSDSKKAFRKVVRRAKQGFYSNKINTASTAKDVFSMTKWHRSTGSFRSPPLKDPTRPDDPPAISLESKRNVLARNLLQNPAEAGDIPIDSPSVPITQLPFPEITDQEIQRAVLRTGSTAPGEDEIVTSVLQAGWALLRAPVTALYQQCLDLGHHPACFRVAILAILSKPNKPDKTSPRAYRPIALLSVLGKGLERLIAKRMSWIAITFGVLAKQQFGALPLRSATDLTTCLTHDIESALNQGKVASLLTLDVKGAFDAVLPGRLVNRLRTQGWSSNLVSWIASFATNRSVRIRLDGVLGPQESIQCGLPQGSPISPILFMLYIAPLLKMGIRKRRFGYADDVALVSISDSLSTNSQSLAASLEEALAWGTEEGITFEPSKSELKHFSRKRGDKSSAPPVQTLTTTVVESPGPLRWLGVQFDRQLTFKDHVKIQAAKALKVSKALSSLGNTVRGVRPSLLQRAVTACVLPIAYYGAETWWPERTRIRHGKKVRNGVDGHLASLAKVVATAARAVLPVYRTTPVDILHRESGIPPPEIALKAKTLASTARLHRLDARHPLSTRVRHIKGNKLPISRFARRVLQLPEAEQVDPLLLPPWEQLDRARAQARIGGPMGKPKEECSKDFVQFIHQISPWDIVIYSDGSKLETGQTGAGAVIYQMNQEVARLAIPLGTRQEVFDAEAIGALEGLKAALKLSTTKFATNLWIFLDNLEVATQLLHQTKTSSQKIFSEFANTAPLWTARHRLPHIQPGGIQVRWVPGHTNIPGNEAADKAAKEGAANTPTTEPNYSLASLKRWAKSFTNLDMGQLWRTVAPEQYRLLGVQTSPPIPRELLYPRHILGRIIASRSGHGDFNAYHTRFNHPDAHTECSCGAKKAPLHFAYCKIAKRRTRRPLFGPGVTLSDLLGTRDGLDRLVSWLIRTRFYDEICTRRPPSTIDQIAEI